MDRSDGFDLLGNRGWLSTAPEPFRATLLKLGRWQQFENGAPVTLGGEDRNDLIGIATGCVVLTSALGPADTPIMYMGRPVFWLGYGPLLRQSPRVVTAVARGQVWAASFPAARIRPMLRSGELDWQPFMSLALSYGDISSAIAAELLIRRSFTRCVSVLLRLGGVRDETGIVLDPIVLPITQAELAGACNLSRTIVGEVLRKLS